MKRIIISLLVVFITCVVGVSNSFELNGSADVNCIVANEDVTTHFDTLNLYTDTPNYYLYTRYADVDGFMVDEGYIKFDAFGSNVRIGRMVRPEGINYLYRPENSVFATHPKDEVSIDGIMLSNTYHNFKLDGFYGSENVWDIRLGTNFFDYRLQPTVTYTSDEQVIVSNEAYYKTTLFAISNITEWNVDEDFFWNRSVIYPGVIDEVGVLVGYYNTDLTVVNQPNFDFEPDAWTVGAYLDLSDNITATVEHQIGEDFDPTLVKFVTRF